MSEKKTVFSGIRNIMNQVGPLLAFIVVCVLLEIATGGRFFKAANISNIMRQVPIIALMAQGMLCVILLGGIDLSAGALLAIGICVPGVLRRHVFAGTDSPAVGILLLLVCVLVAAAFGCLNGILLTKLRLPHPFIATLGTKFVCRGLALLITGAKTISGFPKVSLVIGTYNIMGWLPLSFVMTVFMFILMHIVLTRTVLGREIYSFGGNKLAAKFAGINTDRIQICCYAMSGLFCGLAGIVYLGRMDAAVPLASQDGDMDAIASCIIGGASFLGGKGNVWGTLVGAFMIQVIRNGCNLLKLSTDLQQIVIGIIIIIAVYIDVVRGEMDAKQKLQAVSRSNEMEDTVK